MIWAFLPSTTSQRARTVIRPRPVPVAVQDPVAPAHDTAGWMPSRRTKSLVVADLFENAGEG